VLKVEFGSGELFTDPGPPKFVLWAPYFTPRSILLLWALSPLIIDRIDDLTVVFSDSEKL